MALTDFPLNHDLAVKRWSEVLECEIEEQSYFSRFTGTSSDSIIQAKSELSKAAGDKITFGLMMNLDGYGVDGDNIIEGTDAEEALNTYADYVFIDQFRKGTKSKGKMSEQRVPYNLRESGRSRLSIFMAEWLDHGKFFQLSGARGVGVSVYPLTYTGRAGNALRAPSSNRIVYGGDATAKNDLDSSDKMSRALIEKLGTLSEVATPKLRPIMVEGERKFVLLMHPFQAYDLRASTSTGDWTDLHKNIDATKSPIYSGALGDLNGIILHKHPAVVRFSDYGSGGNVAAARALFMGAQAGVIAYGRGGSENNYSWHEEMDDRGNALAITVGTIVGIQKTRFNSEDYGLFAVDTYATPLAA